MERISFIDLGSNSVRFVIIEIANTGSYQLIYQEKEAIRLSEGMWETNNLTEASMSRALRALKGFAHMAEVMESTQVISVATAAVRLAKNGPVFIQRVKEETGLDLQCISGEEEARLGFLGVINTLDLDDFIIFDLGGASTEVTWVKNRIQQASVSLPVGALTLTASYSMQDAISPVTLERMIAQVEDVVVQNPWLKNRKLPLVGIGGTARNMAKMDQKRQNYPINKIHNYEIPRERLESLFDMVRSKNLNQRKKIPGLSSDRADIIIAGTVIIQVLMDYVNSRSLFVGGCGLREGLFYDYYGKNFLNGTGIIDDILTHSTENVLLSLPQNDLVHSKYVKNLADMLFEQWEPLHQASSRVRKLLSVAALLHDIGKRINYYSHARHGAYMLVNSNLYGINHVEQALCAVMVLNSHGISGKVCRAFDYAALLGGEVRQTALYMSIILSIAEALDETHEELVKSLSTVIKDGQVELTVWVDKACDWSTTQTAVNRYLKSFKKEFKRNLLVHWKEIL